MHDLQVAAHAHTAAPGLQGAAGRTGQGPGAGLGGVGRGRRLQSACAACPREEAPS